MENTIEELREDKERMDAELDETNAEGEHD